MEKFIIFKKQYQKDNIYYEEYRCDLKLESRIFHFTSFPLGKFHSAKEEADCLKDIKSKVSRFIEGYPSFWQLKIDVS